MTKVNSPPPLRLLSVASKGVPLVINFGLETVFFSQIFLFKKRDRLIFKSTRLLYLTPIYGQSSEVKVDYEFTPSPITTQESIFSEFVNFSHTRKKMFEQ